MSVQNHCRASKQEATSQPVIYRLPVTPLRAGWSDNTEKRKKRLKGFLKLWQSWQMSLLCENSVSHILYQVFVRYSADSFGKWMGEEHTAPSRQLINSHHAKNTYTYIVYILIKAFDVIVKVDADSDEGKLYIHLKPRCMSLKNECGIFPWLRFSFKLLSW